MSEHEFQRRSPRSPGDIEGFGCRLGFVQGVHVMTSNHEGVAQQERIVHGDAGRNEHQPATRQDECASQHEVRERNEERRCAQRHGETLAVHRESSERRRNEPYQEEWCEYGDWWPQEMTTFVPVGGSLCVHGAVTSGEGGSAHCDHQEECECCSPSQGGILEYRHASVKCQEWREESCRHQRQRMRHEHRKCNDRPNAPGEPRSDGRRTG